MKQLLHSSQTNAFVLIKTIFAKCFLVLLLAFGGNTVWAQVTITSATGGINISADKAANATSPAYTTIGSIVVKENAVGNILGPVSNQTFTLSPPSGWEFNANAGSFTVDNSGNFTATSMNVSSTSIVFTYSTNNNNKIDTVTITGIQVRALDGANVSGSGNIVFSALSSPITGITAGTTTAGALSQAVGTMSRLVVTLPGQTFTDGTTLAGSGNTGTVTAQTVGTSFNITQLTATDQFYNVITAYTGSKTIAFTGPGTSSGGSPTYTTAVTFASGISTTTLATSLRKAETVAITAREGASFSFASSNLTVNPKALTVSSPAVTSKTYDGTTAATITGTLSGILSGDNVSLNGTGTFVDKNVGIGKAVTSTSTLGGIDAANYTLTQPTGLTGTITASSLTVTATNNTKTYGTLLSNGSSTAFTTSGLQNGETLGTSPSVTLTFGTGAAANASVASSPYNGSVVPTALTLGTSPTATLSNYSISYVNGNIIITTAALNITGLSGVNKVYDGLTTATLLGTAAYSGLQNGESFPIVDTPTASFTTATVGAAKAVTVTGYTAPSANYTISQPSGLTANITKAVLTIAAGNQSVSYGTAVATVTGAGNYTPTGFVNGETAAVIGGSASYTTTYTTTTNVGTLGVTLTPIVTSLTATNYSFSATDGTITVSSATPTVTPTVGIYTYTGLAQGPNTATNSGTGTSYTYSYAGTAYDTTTYSASATPPTKAGNYTVTVTVAADGNYSAASSTPTAFTINKATTTTLVTINGSPFTYTGLPQTPATVTVSGSGLSLTPTAAYINNTNAGTATASYTYAGDANYIGSNDSKNFTIGKAVLTITADNQSVSYGTAVATVTGAGNYTPTGFVNSETAAVIGGSASYATTYTTTTNAGTSGVTLTPIVTSLTATNYSFSTANGTITIIKANSTITATGTTSYIYNGLTQGPTTSIVTGSTGAVTYSYSGTGTTTYGTNSTRPVNTGTYEMVATVATDTNYNGATSTALAFTIATAPLTITGITANNKTYDGLTTATLSGTAVYSGLQNTDSFPVTGTPTASFATATVDSGKAVTISGYTAPSSNYTLTQPSLSANITPANLTITGITVNNKTYDGNTSATLSGTASYLGLQNGETFTVTGTPIASFDTASAGNAKPVTVSGYTNPSSNYTVSQPTGLTANIIAADPTSATASASIICLGASTTLNLIGDGGETAALVKWYTSSCGGTLVGTGNALSVSPSATITYFGRYEGVFTTNCASVTVTVNPISSVGAVSADQTICSGSLPTSDITITSATGTIQWQRADDAGFTTNLINIGTSATTLTIAEVGALTTTKYFRAVVTSGVCPAVTSSTVTVTVNPTSLVGSVSSNQTICSGSSPSSNITIASATGTIQWQSADDAGFTTNLTNLGTNATTLTIAEVGALTATKYFRAEVTSGVCPAVTSSTVTVTVNPTSSVGAVSSNQTICSGSSPSSDITIASATGTIQWQRADDAGFTTNLINLGTSATTLSIAEIGALTTTKYFRARVTSGVCPIVTSGTVTVTVNSLPVGPVIAKSPNETIVCAGTSLTFTVTTPGSGGAISSQDEYRFSTNNGSNWSSWGTGLLSFTAVVGTNIVESRRTSTGFGCTTAAVTSVSWTVNPIPVSGTLTKNPNTAAVCSGATVSATATAGSGGAGTIVDVLEVSLSSGTFSPYISGTSINTTGQTSVEIRTRRTATGSGCTTSGYNTVSWTVNPLPTADAGANRTIFRGDSTTIGATAVPLNTYSWVSNPSGFTSTTSNPTVAPLVNTTYTLTETTPQGCIKTNSITVSVKDNLKITKSLINTTPTKPGDVVTYQISYQNLNNNSEAAQNVTITDILPSTAFFTYTSSSPTGTYDSGNNKLTYFIPNLSAGATGVITVSGRVGVLGTYGYDTSSYYISSGSSTQTITNSASIENALTPVITSNSVSNVITQSCGASMPVTLSGKVHTSTGSNVYYFVEVQNTGTITDRFTLSNMLTPSKISVPLITNITNMAGDPISQTPWISPGNKYGFLVQFTTPNGSPPVPYNYTTITATSTVCSTFATTDIDTYIYNGPESTGCDLLISKTAASNSVIAGSNITYTLLVRNLSNNKAKDLVIDDVLPANLNYISSTLTGGGSITYNNISRLIRVTKSGNYDNNDADIVITITAQTTCSSVPSVLNSASVDNTNLDNNVFNNESSVSVTVLPNVSDPAPTSAIICSGSSTTITLPSPGSGRNYKWYSAATGGTLLQTDGNSYTTGALTASTTYYVSQYNTSESACESNRTPMVVTVVSPPVVNAQPLDINSCGTSISFTYNVSGTFLTQQWQISTDGGTNWTNLANGGVYSGVTNQTLSISNMAGLNGYKYRCNLNSYSCYALTSTVATIVSLPTITGTLSVCRGSTTTLTGSGTAAATSPWTSASTAVATVSNSGVVTGVAAGTSLITYKSNTNCTITALVTVNDLPTITGTLSVCVGSTTILTGSATPDGISPWTSATPAVATVNNSGLVTGVAAGTSLITYKNSNGCIITATVTVNALPIITTQPINQLDCEEAYVNFSILASGASTYTWQYKLPSGSFTAMPVSSNVSYPAVGKIKVDNVGSAQFPDGTQYRVIVSNSNGCSVTSTAATLSVNEIKGITANPTPLPTLTNIIKCYGENNSYTVTTSYPANVVSYQWKSSVTSGVWNDVVNGTHFSGATTATLNIINGTPAETAEYRVYITFTSSGANCNVDSNSRTRMITFLPLLTTPVTSITQPNCATATGTITITVQSASDTYSFDNGSTYQASNSKSGLIPGNYTIIIKNSLGCISPTTTVTINPQPITPALPTLSLSAFATCNTLGSFIITNYNASYSYTVSPNTGVILSGNTVTAPSANYTVIATLGSCSSIASSSVTIAPLITNTWTTSGWSTGTAPTLNTLVIIDADYNTSTNGDLNACSITVNQGKKLTITPNDYTIIQNNLTVNGTLDVLDKGSLIMINDSGTVTNNGTTTIHRFTSKFEKFDYVYWSTPVTSTFIPTTFLNWRTNYAFEFLPANFVDTTPADGFDDNGDDWSYASTMLPGKGYIVMTPTNKNYVGDWIEEVVFSGKVNNGVITTPIALTPNVATDDDFNLVGNPYPSAISADAFINANISTINGTLYFWTHIGDISNSNAGPDGLNFSTNDYAVYTLAGGVGTSGNIIGGVQQNSNKPSGFIASGQGFFVEADIAGTLLFNNAMRVGTETKNNQFYKLQSNNKKSATTVKDRVWLNLENASKMFSQQLIGYFDNATLGFDKGYDGLFSDAGNYINFYSFINNDTYKIQGRSSFDENDQVRLGYSSAVAGAFTISIDSKEGVFANVNQVVLLEDKITNTIFNLQNGSYTFSTEKGTFNDRFVLRYTDNTSLGTNDKEIDDEILVFYSKNHKSLVIKKNSNSSVNTISLFSITGQNIMNWDIKDREQNNIQLLLKESSSGTYIVKIKTTNGESSKKIIIQ